MPALIQPEEQLHARAVPETIALDENVWRAWIAKGRERDRRENEERIHRAKWALVAVLFCCAALWPYMLPYELPVRCAFTLGAFVLMFQSLRATHFVLAVLFGALVLLFDPIVPALTFSSIWLRSSVLAAALVLSFVWRPRGAVHA